MTGSIEIRWFIEGEISNGIVDLIKKQDISFKKEIVRTDWYLLNQDKATGIKLRANNFEVKRLTHITPGFEILPGIKGNVEKWMKYSFSIRNGDDSDEITSGKLPYWFAVEKTRSIAKFTISPDGIINQVLEDIIPTEVCILEICSLKAGDQNWWTLCFEVTGPDKEVYRNLEKVTRYVFRGCNGLTTFTAAKSFGYPQFLLRF